MVIEFNVLNEMLISSFIFIYLYIYIQINIFSLVSKKVESTEMDYQKLSSRSVIT